ncbi:cytosylglucuronate decarboxylase [Paractinoplanes atraurantiacus]|uniref:cytosylglucuronate decarboxylase n=1 Tax=Paractinoplanes atraurantiacus TaxID=1036182 RepID=UPI000BE2FB91|nr:cytosylglucuronate decarboxylase [Actinoplanes atraurantiacus]
MSERERYLFIRILEACNADCFMCEYGLSRDVFRYTPEMFAELLPEARRVGVGFVRFTGGEPLMHGDVEELVRLGTEHGMRMSIITNGMMLPRKIEALHDAGLAQIIVSLDGAGPETHDVFRRSPGMFANGLEGLRRAAALGILPRVNTVVGPHNFAEMPRLQRVLTDAGVQQWELSAIKLNRHIAYPDPDEVRRTCDPIYDADPATNLIPLGRRFYGDTPGEQELYFGESITPRASEPLCQLVDDVIYLDPKNNRAFGCSCLPHRSEDEVRGGSPVRQPDGRQWLDSPSFRRHQDYFRDNGPSVCTGCSTTAAGYSDDVARLGAVPAWQF